MAHEDLPPPTIQNLWPPNTDREYFKDGKAHPFRPLATAFEPVNGWWLAEAALLAYAPEEFAHGQFTRAGLTNVKLFSRSGTQCYVALGPDVAIAVFRGTQVPKLGSDPDRVHLLLDVAKDIRDIIDFRLVPFDKGGAVHAGFLGALDAVWEELLDWLDSNVGGRPLWMTGHSLGGALATLAAHRLQPGRVQGLYTFGSPTVGDRAFADHFRVSTYRFVHHRDIMPRVPPFGFYAGDISRRGNYEHVGTVKYIDGAGRLHDAMPPEVQSLTGLGRDLFESIVSGVSRLPLPSLAALPREPLDDHAPLYYALRAWKVYLDSRS